ncbi:copper resistance protein CopC [Trujillonella humicola]|uniref:copper resistance CopC/CopD family protein n=1 Tax=Trujillonella humicola TaxID=3383699 RepID=UPI00390634CC
MLVLFAALGLGLLADIVTARPALAHAELASTTPAENARLAEAPSEVTLTFTEPVSLGSGHARVINARGERVDTGDASSDGAVVEIPLSAGLPEASYVVSYRVVSADSHPISGAYAFVVGDGELVPAGSVEAGEDTDPGVGAALPVARWVGFAGVALAIGVPVFLLTSWTGGWRDRRMRHLATSGLLATAVGTLLTFLLQGSYTAGRDLGAVLDPGLISATASSAFGIALLFRFAFALLLGVVLALAWRRQRAPSRPLVIAGALAAGGVVVTMAAVGHPVAGPWPPLAVASTAVHVAAMAVWLGGLTALLCGVLRRGTATADVATVLPRHSRVAFAAVGALVVSGVVQSVREVGTPTALFGTTYGRLLMAKLALVLLLLAAAGISRVWVQQYLGVHRRSARGRVTAHAFAAGTLDESGVEAAEARQELLARTAQDEVPALRRSVLVEMLVAVAVLAVTAVLVGTPPARATVAEPVDVVLPLVGDQGSTVAGSLQVTVDPAAIGANTLHVYLFDESDQLTQPQGIRVTLTEAQQEIGPLQVELLPGGPGHYIGDGMTIPSAGTWTLTVSVRLDEFTATTASTDFPVR